MHTERSLHFPFALMARCPKTSDQTCRINIPETLFYQHGSLRLWYSVSDDTGEVFKRDKRECTKERIMEVFCDDPAPGARSRMGASDGFSQPAGSSHSLRNAASRQHGWGDTRGTSGVPVAVHYHYATTPPHHVTGAPVGGGGASGGRESGNSGGAVARRQQTDESAGFGEDLEPLSVDYFDRAALLAFLGTRDNKHNVVVQKFVSGPTAGHSTMQVLWAPHHSVVLCRQNIHNPSDVHALLYQRCVTFEHAPQFSREVRATPTMISRLSAECQRFVDHCALIEQRQILRMVCFFCFDRAKRPTFLYAAEIQMTAHPMTAAEASQHQQFQVRRHLVRISPQVTSSDVVGVAAAAGQQLSSVQRPAATALAERAPVRIAVAIGDAAGERGNVDAVLNALDSSFASSRATVLQRRLRESGRLRRRVVTSTNSHSAVDATSGHVSVVATPLSSVRRPRSALCHPLAGVRAGPSSVLSNNNSATTTPTLWSPNLPRAASPNTSDARVGFSAMGSSANSERKRSEAAPGRSVNVLRASVAEVPAGSRAPHARSGSPASPLGSFSMRPSVGHTPARSHLRAGQPDSSSTRDLWPFFDPALGRFIHDSVAAFAGVFDWIGDAMGLIETSVEIAFSGSRQGSGPLMVWLPATHASVVWEPSDHRGNLSPQSSPPSDCGVDGDDAAAESKGTDVGTKEATIPWPSSLLLGALCGEQPQNARGFLSGVESHSEVENAPGGANENAATTVGVVRQTETGSGCDRIRAWFPSSRAALDAVYRLRQLDVALRGTEHLVVRHCFERMALMLRAAIADVHAALAAAARGGASAFDGHRASRVGNAAVSGTGVAENGKSGSLPRSGSGRVASIVAANHPRPPINVASQILANGGQCPPALGADLLEAVQRFLEWHSRVEHTLLELPEVPIWIPCPIPALLA